MDKTLATVALVAWGFGMAVMAQSVQVGTKAPAPVLLAMSGDSYKFLSELYYEGAERPGARRSAVVLNFMAQDSAPSVEALPLLMAVARKVQSHGDLRGKARFFLVSTDSLAQKNNLPLFLDRHRVGPPMDVLLDPHRKASVLFGVEKLPRTFVISGDGIIVADIEGVGGGYTKALATGIGKAIRNAGVASNPVRAAANEVSPARPGSAATGNGDPNQPMQW